MNKHILPVRRPVPISMFLLLVMVLCLLAACTRGRLEVSGMSSYQTSSFTIHHIDENLDTLQDLATILESTRQEARAFFGKAIGTTDVYIYPDHESFRTRKYGFIGNLLSLDWYIGDNIGPALLILSPDNPTSHHSRKSILGASGHEFIHTAVHRLYPSCPLWLNEGAALYLTNAETDISRYSAGDIPPPRIFTSRNPLYFAGHNGYAFADKYLAYVLERHGTEALFALMAGFSYREALGTSMEESYAGWVAQLGL